MPHPKTATAGACCYSHVAPVILTPRESVAVWRGTQTQFRRLVLPQPLYPLQPGSGAEWKALDPHTGLVHGRYECPYGRPGDLLWAQEATVNVEAHGFVGPVYMGSDAANQILQEGLRGQPRGRVLVPPDVLSIRPASHMVRDTSRVTLRVTDVVVERLLDVTEAGAAREGFEIPAPGVSPRSRRAALLQAWDMIKPSHYQSAANPFIYVVSVDVLPYNIDALLDSMHRHDCDRLAPARL